MKIFYKIAFNNVKLITISNKNMCTRPNFKSGSYDYFLLPNFYYELYNLKNLTIRMHVNNWMFIRR